MSVNKVILVGNLGNDPELRVMPNGGSVAKFSLATSKSWKDSQGQKREKTEWHRCVAFDRGNYKMAEYIVGNSMKGTKLYVEGELETREWEKDGIKRYATEIKVNEFEILANGVPRDGQQQPQQNQGGFNQQPQPQPQPRPQQFSPQNPAGTPTDPWANYVPTGTAASASIEQIKAKAGGNLEAALNNGWLAPKPNPQQAPNFDDFDSDIPF